MYAKKVKKLQSEQDRPRVQLVDEIMRDFEERKRVRRNLELQWQLNIDFANGRQNNYITKFDTLTSVGKQFFWQADQVFNHITPMIETRLAKLSSEYSGFKAKVVKSNHSESIEEVTIANQIVESALQKVGFDELVESANMWSELTGTVFFKVLWDSSDGCVIGDVDGNIVKEGDVNVVIASSFEIFPDNLNANNIEECSSIIHAKLYSSKLVEQIWGERVGLEDEVLVVEKYQKPCCKYPQGRLIIVASGRILHDGPLPYINQINGGRCFPFIRQTSELVTGQFYGRSVIERAIPVQRAYNALKNRKTEFLNRLACGVVAVEEGSVDLDSLENDGLAPGKVIVYRQGSSAPKFMDCGTLPAEFEREEERLLKELYTITGCNDLARSAGEQNISGVALQILVEQDNLRMNRVVKSIKRATSQVAMHVLRLYKQFAGFGRVSRIITDNIIEQFYWNHHDIEADDIVVS